MGLDLTVAKTKDCLNLCELVAIYDVIHENMDWYLEEDKSKRYARYLDLTSRAFALTKKDVLNSAEDKELEEHLKFIPNELFDVYLSYVRSTIGDFNKENSHLSFEFDKLPFASLKDSYSWILHGLFKECKAEDIELPGQGDFIMELDKGKLIELERKWSGKSFKIWIARWIGYFKPEVEERICQDLCRELLPNEYGLDADDIHFYRNAVMDVCSKARKSKEDERIWMISSY